MKKIFTIVSVLTLAVLISFACKKSSSSTSSSSTSSSTTTSSTGSTTSTTGTTTGAASTVTLTATSGPLTGTVTPSCYPTTMYGSSNTNISIGSVNIYFSAAPSAGTYNVVTNSPTSAQAMVAVNGNYYTGGSVTISVVGGKNKAVLNNVTTTGYTLTGSIQCP